MAYTDDAAAVDAVIATMKEDVVAPYVSKTDLEAFWNALNTLLDALELRVCDCCGPY